LVALLGVFSVSVFADVYMHNPRGSNDRNCERNVNRNNENRLFDRFDLALNVNYIETML
jgi:hypothetical protein